jgi:hypothetical protein
MRSTLCGDHDRVDGYVFPEKLTESSPDEMKNPSLIQGDQKE